MREEIVGAIQEIQNRRKVVTENAVRKLLTRKWMTKISKKLIEKSDQKTKFESNFRGKSFEAVSLP